MTPSQLATLREGFEAWADANLKSNHYSLERHVDKGTYLWCYVEEAWDMWQKIAIAQAAQPSLLELRDKLMPEIEKHNYRPKEFSAIVIEREQLKDIITTAFVKGE